MMDNLKNKTLLCLPLIGWLGIGFVLVLTCIFLFFYEAFSGGRLSAMDWMTGSWNQIADMEHGWLIPPVSAFMVYHAVKRMKHLTTEGSLHGLWGVALGAILCVISVRTQQPRLAIVALPSILCGVVWYYWGRQAFIKCAFPLFFICLGIPLPGFQQATVGLQLLAAEVAHWGANLFGVETTLVGTNVVSVDGSWDTYNIVGGCSGIRSLMALLMISLAWAFLADRLVWWKRILLALSAIPLSIIGNSFRVISIFVCAEYINPAFAGKTWHDWSGLLFFFPATLVGLTVLYGILLGEIPFLRKRKVIIRKNNSDQTEGDEA